MQNNNDDPNTNKILDGVIFQGKNILYDDVLKYPNGQKIKVGDHEFVFVQVKNNNNKIGYVDFSYLKKISETNEYEYKLNTTLTETLRLEPNATDPNTDEGKYLKGYPIDNNDILLIPNGEISANGFVIVQEENDPSTIGYINHNNIEAINPIIEANTPIVGGQYNYKYKYLKYKEKYIKLKKMIK